MDGQNYFVNVGKVPKIGKNWHFQEFSGTVPGLWMCMTEVRPNGSLGFDFFIITRLECKIEAKRKCIDVGQLDCLLLSLPTNPHCRPLRQRYVQLNCEIFDYMK